MPRSRRSKNTDPRCEQCGSQRFHVNDEGFTICARGHPQTHIAAQTRLGDDEEEYVGRQGLSHRRRIDEATIEPKEVLKPSGREGFQYYLLAMQWVLWRQCEELASKFGFPAEHHGIVRDLWALRLKHYADRSRTGGSLNEAMGDRLYSSQQAHEQEDTNDEESQYRFTRHRLDELAMPRLNDTLALCYLGAVILRLPIVLADLYRWAHRREILYYEANKAVPDDLIIHLRPPAFETVGLVNFENLQTTAYNIAMAFHVQTGMTLPPLNHTLLFFRFVKELALPLTVFEIAMGLQDRVKYPFQYHFDKEDEHPMVTAHPEMQAMALIVVATRILFPFDREPRYVMDGTEAAALSMDWKAWNAAQEQSKQQGHVSHDSQMFAKAMQTTEQDVMNMTSQQMDQYMDFYAQQWMQKDEYTMKTLGGARGEAEFTQWVFDAFPLPARDKHETSQPGDMQMSSTEVNDAASQGRIQQVQRSLQPRRVDSTLTRTPTTMPGRQNGPRYYGEKQRMLRVGDPYPRWTREEDLPDIARPFFREVADLLGVGVPRLLTDVHTTETRIQRGATGAGNVNEGQRDGYLKPRTK